MSLFNYWRLLQKMPKVAGCRASPTPCISAKCLRQPWLGIRTNSSVTNIMQTVKSRFRKLINLGPSGETKPMKVQQDTFVKQQVTPIVTEMIIQQSTLDSMLYVCEKLLPKMTLADKCIIQEMLTDMLYSDIIASSQSFIKDQSKKDTHYHLLVEKTLSNAVKPLAGSIVFKKLVEDITADVGHMTNQQVVSLFLNLQLLDWEKESREVFKLFERIHGIKAQNLTIDEVLIYARAFKIYKPTWYSTHTLSFLFYWCTINEIDMENTSWLGILDLVMMAKTFSSKDGVAQEFFEKGLMKLEGQNIQSLDIYESLVLLRFSKIGRIFPSLKKKYHELHGEMLNHLKKLIKEVTDKDVVLLCREWNHSLMNSFGNDLATVIEQKFLQPLLEENVPRDDVILCSYMLAFSMNQSEFTKVNKENIKLNSRIRECLKNADAVSLRITGHDVYINFFKEHYLSIIDRVESFVNEGLFDRDEIPLSLKRYYGRILITAKRTSFLTGNKAVSTDLRDKFLDDYLKHHVYDAVLQNIGCELCVRYPHMTPTSIMFLEKIKTVNLDPYESIGILSKMKEFAKDTRYRRNLCKVSYSQSLSALSKLESDVMKRMGCIYKPDEFSRRLRFFKSYKSEPVLTFLSRHTLNSKIFQQKKLSFSLYAQSKTDPRFNLDFHYNSLQTDISEVKAPRAALSVCSDCFFWGYRSGDAEKISSVLKQIDKTDVKDAILKEILYQENVVWSQLIKDHYKTYKKLVGLPRWIIILLKKAFDNHMGIQINTADNLPIEAVVLLDSSFKPVPFSKRKLETAAEHGLQKVAFFFNTYNSESNSYLKGRLIKDLQNAGFKCVVIWREELNSIANRTNEENIQFIRTKVRAENPVINTAHKLSYDPTKILEGPYKNYFSALSKED